VTVKVAACVVLRPRQAKIASTHECFMPPF
jgi:hypothetical protein